MATLTVPDPIPSPAEDAEKLRKAFQGWGTDEKAVIAILAHRDAAQREQIRLAYEELYKENLITRLESELSGHFERAVYRWIFDPVEREAIMANVALKKNVDYQVIIEIACVNSPKELLAVKQTYHARYKHSLEEDVASNTIGDFRKLLVALVSTYRYDGEETNTGLAKSEAKILHDVIEQKIFNDDEVIRILSTRSKAQLTATFNCYKDEYGSITKALAGESPNEFALALRIAIRCITSPKKYFAKVLRHGVDSGADEDALTRVIVMHAEKDLKEIKEMFHKRTNAALGHAVAKVTSGDYKSFLLALIGD
ncbi:annexin-like protein RJ4 [Phoenix dactylifera]|uniref:Annexin-like protein RJ4 n=1 Tax=Phoenix dactylifera TaxID=42345 RepID=A0A8B7BWN9_PHODC|nr:annexin-like protein RJ4 [Phoenix dactylifera]